MKSFLIKDHQYKDENFFGTNKAFFPYRKYKDSNFARENLPTYLSKKQQKSNTQSFGDRMCKERVVFAIYPF